MTSNEKGGIDKSHSMRESEKVKVFSISDRLLNECML